MRYCLMLGRILSSVKTNIYKSEKMLNGFVILSLVGIAFDFIFRYKVSGFEKSIFMWVANIIFFNSLHVAFTFVNIIFLPEYKKVLYDYFKLSGVKIFLGYLFILGFFLLVHDYGFRKDILFLRIPAIFAITVLPAWHRTKQTMGISLLKNSDFLSSLTQEERRSHLQKDEKSRRFEHVGVNLLIASVIPATLIRYSKELKVASGLLKPIEYISVSCGFLALLIVYFSFRQLQSWVLIKKKIVISMRYLIYTLRPLSFLAIFSTSCIHGFEYMIIQEKSFSRSKVQKSLFLSYIFASIILCVILEFCVYPTQQNYLKLMSKTWVTNAMIVGGVTFVYLHYALDQFLFQMRVPEIREEMTKFFQEEIKTSIEPVSIDKAS